MVRLPPISKRTDTLITYTPLFGSPAGRRRGARPCAALRAVAGLDRPGAGARAPRPAAARNPRAADRPRPEADHQPAPLERSEEHTSELQSLLRISYAVFCFKKKTLNNSNALHIQIERAYRQQ